MTYIKELNISLSDWEIRAILESISREMERLKTINETSDDEDEQADAGNDFLELKGLQDRLKEQAVEVFGDQILNFSREQI